MAAIFPNWLHLPKELTTKILHKVGAVEVLKSAQFVCTQWYSISMDPLFWRTIHVTQKSKSDVITTAINRSCGQLEDITIAYPTLSLLHHIIANRVASSFSVSQWNQFKAFEATTLFAFFFNEDLKECVKKLPLLEELDLSYDNLSMDCVETIGESCPLLKDFKIIKKRKHINGIECDDDALAIAKTMQNLRHLTLLGNRISNAGLLAILDGCPHLESLDLRGCLNLDLQETSLKKRCADAEIKQFRVPYEYLAESSDEELGTSDIVTFFSELPLNTPIEYDCSDLLNALEQIEFDPSCFILE